MTPIPGRSAGAGAERAQRWLAILSGVLILSSGAVTAAATATASPWTGTVFALGAVSFSAAFVLAARIVRALERARRSLLPPPPPLPPRSSLRLFGPLQRWLALHFR